jgi:hypothetical protein
VSGADRHGQIEQRHLRPKLVRKTYGLLAIERHSSRVAHAKRGPLPRPLERDVEGSASGSIFDSVGQNVLENLRDPHGIRFD